MKKDWLNIVNKTYIVTGGSSGIGFAIIEALLKEGAIVVNADLVDNDQLANQPNYRFQKTNVAVKSDTDRLAAATIAANGKIDGLINNAGINLPRLLVDKNNNPQYELSEGDLDKMIAINMKGVVLLTQSVAKEMMNVGTGVIINMSSESGLEGSEGQSCYAATKAALYSYTRSWSKELGKHGIRVVGIAPGIMEKTGLRTQEYEESLAYTRDITIEQLRQNYSKVSTIPLGRSGKLKEVADLVCYYLSDRASYITGVTTNIAGGKTRG